MAKKSFGEIANPALQFMTQPEDNRTAAAGENNAAGFNGLKRGRPASKEETKTKRVNLLMLPSVYTDIVKIAAMKRTSFNDLVNTLLQEYINNNRDLVDKYNDVFKE